MLLFIAPGHLTGAGQSEKTLTRRCKWQPVIGVLVLICTFLLFPALIGRATWSVCAFSGHEPSESADEMLPPDTVLLGPSSQAVPDIDGESYVLYDAASQTFLIGKNADKPLPPASITKVMTVLLALELLDPDDTITVTREMFKDIPNDYARLGLVEGEVITVREALYASLLISANDAAMALAISMGTTVEKFADMMNERALELGCKRTHFTNPYGYADDNHVTTAHDMALITAEALTHAIYTEMALTRHHMMPPTNSYNESRGMTNGNRFVSTDEFAYEPYIGGKTGYTALSRYTIVAGARQENRLLIGVILGASNSPVRYGDLISLFEYGFDQYVMESTQPDEFADISDRTIQQVQMAIDRDNLPIAIDRVMIQLKPYTLTTSSRAASDYLCRIAPAEAIKPDAADQLLVYRLYHQYADSYTDQVGTLQIALRQTPPEPTTAVSGQDTIHAAGTSGGIFRPIALVLLIAAVILCLLTLSAMLKHDLRRRRRRKKPGMF